MPQNNIQYLTRKEIDTALWNACVDKASNGLIYAYSFYLDAMTDNWDALVLNDYEAVMPLPWRKKYGIYYLYQPAFVAQLGLFGNNLTADLLTAFLNAVPKKFRYWDFTLNHENRFVITNFPLYQRSNFVLNLGEPYQKIFEGYRKKNIQHHIKKIVSYNCYTKKNIPVEDVVQLAKQQVQQQETGEDDYKKLISLYYLLFPLAKAITYGIYSSQHQLLASGVFFFSHRRAYYILAGNHPNGRTLGASHALIDAFIKDHATQDLILDFEGSDIQSLAFFYSSFGAVQENYAAIKLNRLPWWAKWLKG